MLTRRIWAQLIVFIIISVAAAAIMVFDYIDLPTMLFGVGRYTVTVDLPEAAGLYNNGNVTYRGTEVGRIESVALTGTGVRAVLSLDSGTKIPSDLQAEVHSQSAIGEQYVALLPRDANSPPLRDGDVIARSRTTVPPDVNALLDAANRGLEAIPQDNLRTAVDEANAAVGGLGTEISRIVSGSTALAIDARKYLEPLNTLIDQSQPVLDSQTGTADSIQQWAAHLANITKQLQVQDRAVAGLLDNGGPATREVHQLLDHLQPTLPVLLANLVSVGQVAVTYQNDIEQLLVLVPQGTAVMQGITTPDRHNDRYKGVSLSFNTNLNIPPQCNTGFLPPQQQRVPTLLDYPDRAPGDLYCRIPQDAPFEVRGVRNAPCETRPGKRAPTVKMCESDENYVPLNDGFNWKGDPNATLSGQDVPQLESGLPPSPTSTLPPIAVAQYDPATGTYVGPDGRIYNQSDLAQETPKGRTWQSMLMPGGE